jgi:hypothetical protein
VQQSQHIERSAEDTAHPDSLSIPFSLSLVLLVLLAFYFVGLPHFPPLPSHLLL